MTTPPRKRSWTPTPAHLVSAVIGGLVVGAGFLIAGVTSQPPTETINVPLQSPASAQSEGSSAGLPTANQIYQRYAPAVVFVRAKLIEPVQGPYNLFDSGDPEISTGSGFVVDRRGDILTAYHLINGADRTNGVTVEFEDQTFRKAAVVAVDQKDDLAVLHVSTKGLPTVIPLKVGDSTSVQVGDPTLTIGNPFGLDRTLTSGIVSALQHQIRAADGTVIENVIETDQATGPGTSGAPLLNSYGRVIGVNSQVATSPTGDGARVSFAVPIDTAETAVLAKVIPGAPVLLAYLGLGPVVAKDGSATTPAAGKSTASKHAIVGTVVKAGPAAQAGVRVGDLIERIDGLPVHSIYDVLNVVSTRSPGQDVALLIRREHHNKAITVTVTLGSRSAAK